MTDYIFPKIYGDKFVFFPQTRILIISFKCPKVFRDNEKDIFIFGIKV